MLQPVRRRRRVLTVKKILFRLCCIEKILPDFAQAEACATAWRFRQKMLKTLSLNPSLRAMQRSGMAACPDVSGWQSARHRLGKHASQRLALWLEFALGQKTARIHARSYRRQIASASPRNDG
jgi:hypothetical protein